MLYELNKYMHVSVSNNKCMVYLPLYEHSFIASGEFPGIIQLIHKPMEQEQLCQLLDTDVFNLLLEHHVLIPLNEDFLHFGLLRHPKHALTDIAELSEIKTGAQPSFVFTGVSACFGNSEHASCQSGHLHIRKALRKIFKNLLYKDNPGLVLIDENLNKTISADDIQLQDLGDLPFHIGLDTYETYSRKITKLVTAIAGAGHVPLFAGGDHSNSYFIINALTQVHPLLNVVVFDAHTDMYDPYPNSFFVNHANVFDHVQRLDGVQSVLQVGVRKKKLMSNHQQNKPKVTTVSSRDILMKGMTCENIFERLDPVLPVYISVDADVLDPSLAPEVPFPEPGGLNYYHLVQFLEYLSAHHKIVGYDFTEVSSTHGEVNKAAKVIGNLIYSVLSSK